VLARAPNATFRVHPLLRAQITSAKIVNYHYRSPHREDHH
jgi:hypothetical protein